MKRPSTSPLAPSSTGEDISLLSKALGDLNGATSLKDERVDYYLATWAPSCPLPRRQFNNAVQYVNTATSTQITGEACKGAVEAYAASVLSSTAMCELLPHLRAPKSSWRTLLALYTLRKLEYHRTLLCGPYSRPIYTERDFQARCNESAVLPNLLGTPSFQAAGCSMQRMLKLLAAFVVLCILHLVMALGRLLGMFVDRQARGHPFAPLRLASPRVGETRRLERLRGTFPGGGRNGFFSYAWPDIARCLGIRAGWAKYKAVSNMWDLLQALYGTYQGPNLLNYAATAEDFCPHWSASLRRWGPPCRRADVAYPTICGPLLILPSVAKR